MKAMISIPNKQFYPDGVNKSNGNAYGKTVFSPMGYLTWSSSVLNPTSFAGGIFTESTQLLSSQDDAPIPGIRLINNTSQYFPIQR